MKAISWHLKQEGIVSEAERNDDHTTLPQYLTTKYAGIY